MKQRIDWVVLFAVLTWSTLAFAQEPPTSEPEEPAEGPLDEGPLDEPAAPAEEAPAAEPSEPAAGAEGEAGAQAEGEIGGEIGASTAGEAGGEAAAGAAAEVPVEAPDESSGGDEIVVTGSRIKTKTAFSTSQAVDVIDRKQLEHSGATNLADVVQNISATNGNGFRGQGAGAGSVAVNLRGLGFSATLVLVNGRRMTPSASGVTYGFSDLAVIPLSAVERIEVLKGGGSAVYGSDAVGGVVNIITRKNFDGVRIEADAQTTEEFDQRDGTVSVAFGANSERGRVMTGLSYFQSTELTAEERDFTKGKFVSTSGWPASYVVGTAPQPDPGCAQVPGSTVTESPAGSGRRLCTWDYRAYTSLLGSAERANGFSSGEYDVTNHTTLFGELNVSRLRSWGTSSPSFSLPPTETGFPQVPADHVDNPFGVQVGFIGRPLGNYHGRARSTADDDTLRVVGGIKGDFEGAAEGTFFESWEWEAFTSFGISRYRTIVHDNLRQPFLDALNACADPADLSRCFNPFYSALDGTGTPNSDAVIESFASETENLTDHALQTYNAGMAGSLFELPGGDLGLAFGGEIRHEWRATEIDHDANLNRFAFLYGNSDARADRDVYSGYLELRFPFYDGIELQTAGRAEFYKQTTNTSAISPSAGLTISPADIAGRDNTPSALHRLQLRGQVTRAFRSPTLYQAYPGRATVPTALVLPGSALPVFLPVVISGNPGLKPESALVWSAGLLWSPIDELGLMAEYWSYDYKNRILPDSANQIIATYAANGNEDPRVIENAQGTVIRVEGKQNNVDGSVATNGLDFGATVTLTGKTFGGGVDDWGSFSLAAIGNYTFSYTIPRREAGPIVLPGGAGTLPPPDCDGESSTSPCEISGKRNATTIGAGAAALGTGGGGALPKLRMNLPITYDNSGHAISVIPHYIGGFEDDLEPNADGSFDEVDAMITLDLQYGYTLKDVVGDELTVRIGMYNVFDTEPPHVNGLTSAYEAVHDPRGRMFFAKLVAQL